MNKSELESKHLAELHTLAAEAGVDGYRMLPRAELIAALADGEGGGGGRSGGGREPRRRSSSGGSRDRRPRDRQREPRKSDEPRDEPAKPEAAERAPEPAAAASGGSEEKPRRRRRRRFGRRGRKTVRVQDLLLPASPGRHLVYAESRAAGTVLLRELAAELSGGRGPDPVALLIDPSPEELADWKREAPKAEIVSAGQERHAEDALAQATRRAESGEAVVLLIDSLSRAAEEFGGSKTATELFEAGGQLTVIAAIERPGE
jgi:transcription termination factor Rho